MTIRPVAGLGLLLILPLLLVPARAADPRAGTAPPGPIHFRPEKGDFGDPIPFHHGDDYHVFYLIGGYGRVNWEHIVSRNLRDWKQLPTALKPDGAPDSPDGEVMFTGCVMEHDGTYHAYYTGHNSRNPKGLEFVMHATSPDAITWTKIPGDIFGPDGVVYNNDKDADFRDPFVFRDDAGNRWLMALCARTKGGKKPVTGLYSSTDLVHWKAEPPLAVDYPASAECPDVFPIGDRWFIVTSPSTDVVVARSSPTLQGSYSPVTAASAIDTPILYAAKRQFDGKRHVLTGWLRDLEGGKDGGKRLWGGVQSLPREMFAGPDGQLLSRPVPEVREPFRKAVLDLAAKPEPRAVGEATWHYRDGHLVAQAAGSPALARFDAPANYQLSMKVKLTPEATFALDLRQQAADAEHYRLELRPSKHEVTMSGPGFDYPRPVNLDASREIAIEAFVQGSVIECFVDGSHAFSTRAYNLLSGSLGLSVANGTAEVTELVVRVSDSEAPAGR